MDRKLSSAELVIVIAGAVALLGSFLPWIDFHSFQPSAWSDDLSFPTYAWVGIFGGLMALQVAIRTFANVSMPSDVLGFTWTQVHLVLGVFTLILVVSFLIAGDEFGIGFWLSLPASIALVVGARMQQTSGTTLH